jgi:hypothetical protein
MIMQVSFEANLRDRMKDTILIMYFVSRDREVFVLVHSAYNTTYGRVSHRIIRYFSGIFRDAWNAIRKVKTRWCHHKDLITLRAIKGSS